jgi:chromosome segregation ATPase
MQFYLQLFVSDLLPSPKSIYDATVTKFLQDMVSKFVVVYRESMAKGSDAVVTHTDFNILHLDSKKKVIDSYDAEKKIGKDSSIIYYRNQLIDKIEEILNERNQTMYYKIETRMTNRKLEAQKSETLRQEMEIQDLKRKQEEAKKRFEETQKQHQQNVNKLNKQHETIQKLTYTISQQQDEIEREREALKAREAQLKQEVANINTKLQNQENQSKLLNATLQETVKERENIKKALEDNKNETAQEIQTLTATINIQQNEFNKELENRKTREKELAEKYEKTIDDVNKKMTVLKDEIARKEKEEKERIEKLNRIPRKAYFKQGDCYLCAQDSTHVNNDRRKTDCCESGT